ncbi:MAG: hypothetical protein M1831_001005 [Alyxoria varia]|nr:MAG: hypothetical protein M1831_001005 [Alyxoria varia]
MVVLAASICTRGGKAVLSRQFREMQRSRVEALLASFPKLADAGTQHTTVEQDNVRYVYQPLDELYMVLITNRQSNILQDIDSLHLFAQVVTSICRSLDEREILRNAFELLSAFDEIVNLGYRENLTMAQIKTFLDMESHEERVAMIIESNKQSEAAEQRKMNAHRIEMQRREQARAGRTQMPPRPPTYPTYTPPTVPTTTGDPMDSYAAEKNRTTRTAAPASGKGMQLGKKSKSNMYDKVRADLGPEEEASAPLAGVAAAPTAPTAAKPSARSSLAGDREAIHVTVAETISAKLSREGSMETFDVSGNLQLNISDASLTQIKLDLTADDSRGAQWFTHPKVDKPQFLKNKIIQLKDTSRGFPKNTSLEVLRWKHSAKPGSSSDDLPLTVTAWVNQGSDDTYSVTVEYEFTGSDSLKDVVLTIPFATAEPAVSSYDAIYEVSGDSLDWNIGTVDLENSNGSFEFEAQAETDADFFPMSVRFSKTKPFVDVDVSSVTLLNMNQDISFSKAIRSVADKYIIE